MSETKLLCGHVLKEGAKASRGVCLWCYTILAGAVRLGLACDDDLVRAGKLLPSVKGRRPNFSDEVFAADLAATGGDLAAMRKLGYQITKRKAASDD